MIKDSKGEYLISEEYFAKLFLIGEITEQDFENIVKFKDSVA
jgi:hypothetical protein